LERRTARGGRDNIDHAPGGRDDLGNAALGALGLAAGGLGAVPFAWCWNGYTSSHVPDDDVPGALLRAAARRSGGVYWPGDSW
jgi:hypothetical protein